MITVYRKEVAVIIRLYYKCKLLCANIPICAMNIEINANEYIVFDKTVRVAKCSSCDMFSRGALKRLLYSDGRLVDCAVAYSKLRCGYAAKLESLSEDGVSFLSGIAAVLSDTYEVSHHAKRLLISTRYGDSTLLVLRGGAAGASLYREAENFSLTNRQSCDKIL